VDRDVIPVLIPPDDSHCCVSSNLSLDGSPPGIAGIFLKYYTAGRRLEYSSGISRGSLLRFSQKHRDGMFFPRRE